jgi:hypothetical protein
MKALITAFALLSFVAASSIPMATTAYAKTEHSTKHKKVVKKKTHKKVVHNVHNKGTKSTTKMKKPSQA